MSNAIKELVAEESKTQAADWQFTEGPESDNGEDFYLHNPVVGKDVYVNVDGRCTSLTFFAAD